MTINVIGQQFTWTFEYPQSGGDPIRSNQLYLAEDQSVQFKICRATSSTTSGSRPSA